MGRFGQVAIISNLIADASVPPHYPHPPQLRRVVEYKLVRLVHPDVVHPFVSPFTCCNIENYDDHG